MRRQVVHGVGDVRRVLELFLDRGIRLVAQELNPVWIMLRIGDPGPGRRHEVFVGFRLKRAKPNVMKPARQFLLLTHDPLLHLVGLLGSGFPVVVSGVKRRYEVGVASMPPGSMIAPSAPVPGGSASAANSSLSS